MHMNKAKYIYKNKGDVRKNEVMFPFRDFVKYLT